MSYSPAGFSVHLYISQVPKAPDPRHYILTRVKRVKICFLSLLFHSNLQIANKYFAVYHSVEEVRRLKDILHS